MSTIPAPNLGSVITSTNARKFIYAAYVLALLVVGGVQVYYGATGTVQPEFVGGIAAVLVYLGIPVGGLALVNTPTKGPDERELLLAENATLTAQLALRTAEPVVPRYRPVSNAHVAE